jgi:hypothetical protein
LANEGGRIKAQLRTVDDTSLETVEGEASSVADAANAIADATDAATDAILRMVESTRGPLSEMEANVNAISLGRSPGGLKEIAIQASHGADAVSTMSASVKGDLQELEGTARGYMKSAEDFVRAIGQQGAAAGSSAETAAAAAASAVLSLEDTARSYMTSAEDFVRTVGQQGPEGAAAETAATQALLAQPEMAQPPPVEPPPPAVSPTIIVHQAPVRVQFRTLDPSKARDVWEGYIRPEMEKDLDTNHKQLAHRIGKAVRQSGATYRLR